MVWFRNLWGLKVLVIALYALTLALLGFAHQTSAIAAPVLELAAYALPDGSLPDVCAGDGQSSDQHGIPQGASKGLCDACLLTSAPGSVLSSDSWTPVKQTASRLLFGDMSARRVIRAVAHVPPPRGPPATA